MMDRVINTAIVAFGMSGKYFHAPFIDTSDKFNLYAMLERKTAHAKEIYPDVKIVKDLSQILTDKNIELVIISSPNDTHYEYAKTCLLADKHVIIEKPFAITSEEAEELFKIANDQNRIAAAFHNRRWDGDYITAKKIIESGKLGELREYESHFDRFRNYIVPNKWKEEDRPGTGLLHDLGPHLIDQAISLFGRPKSVSADLRKQRKNTIVTDYFDLILDYGELKVQLKSGYLIKEKAVRFLIRGTEGSFVKYGLDPQEDDLKAGMKPGDPNWGKDSEENWGTLYYDLDGLSHSAKVETARGNYQSYFENIYEAITNQSGLIIRPEDVLLTMRCIEAALESSKSKSAVTV
jgi:scyllo-inositol 2-dehydrogenase (NADP+)